MRTRQLIVVALVGAALAACGRTAPPGHAVQAEANAVLNPIAQVPGEVGRLHLRKVYDYVTPGKEFISSYRGQYDPAGRMNGSYDYAEPIFGGWPIRLTPLDSSGNPAGPSNLVTTLPEYTNGGGRYVTLPVGTYRVEEVHPTGTTGGGTWEATGANITSASGQTTSHGITAALTVQVATDSTVTARFFNVCRVGGNVADFPSDAIQNVNNVAWACRPQFAPDFGIMVDPDRISLQAGGSTQVEVELIRVGGFSGAVGVTAPNPPPGITATPVVIPSGSSVGTVSLQASSSAPAGDSRFYLVGAASGNSRGASLSVNVGACRPGDVDTTYGTGGRMVHEGFSLLEVERQLDGRYLIAGGAQNGAAVGRLLADGTRDTTFGTNGVAVLPFDTPSAAAGIAAQQDGKVVVTGRYYGPEGYAGTENAYVARFNADGTIDTSFADNGVRYLQVNLRRGEDGLWHALNAVGQDIAVQADGRIVVTGWAHMQITNNLYGDFALYITRLNPDGSLDTTYGDEGFKDLMLADRNPIPLSLVLDSLGRAVISGEATKYGDTRGLVVRFTPAGQLDPTFATGGVFVTEAGKVFRAFDLALQPDGRIVIAGAPGDQQRNAARLLPNGTPDPTFGDGGYARSRIGVGAIYATGVTLAADGKIIVAGGGLQRYLATGVPDEAFGRSSIATVPSGWGVLIDVFEQADGKLLAFGTHTPFDTLVTRFCN